MKISESVREMPVRDAVAIFARYGIRDADSFDDKHLRAARMALAKRFHGDTGGTGGEMGEINAAYDSLKKNLSGFRSEETQKQPQYRSDPHNWRNIDNIKRYFAERSAGNPNAKKWYIQNWDGHFWRQSFVIVSTLDDSVEIANKMHQWQAHFALDTLFASQEGTYGHISEAKHHLIWHRGQSYTGKNAPVYDPDDYSTFGSQSDYRFPDRLNAWIREVTGTPQKERPAAPSDWRVFGFNGHFFNDGAKFQGGDDLLVEAARRAKTLFETSGFGIAIWAQNRTLEPTKLRLVYFMNHYYEPADTPSIVFEWGDDDVESRPGAATTFCQRARDILIAESKSFANRNNAEMRL